MRKQILGTAYLESTTESGSILLCRSKQHTYDDVVDKVAQQIQLEDSSKIRLTSHNCYSQQPKPQPIKYRGVERLSDMLVHYNQVRRIPLFLFLKALLTAFPCLWFFMWIDWRRIGHCVLCADFRYPIFWNVRSATAWASRLENFEGCLPQRKNGGGRFAHPQDFIGGFWEVCSFDFD